MRKKSQKIIVASLNPVKLDATRRGFAAMFPDEHYDFSGVDGSSGVADQPMSRTETLIGATNRAKAAHKQHPDADYTIGIEGGIEPDGDYLAVFAWVVVLHQEQIGSAQTGVFYLPQEVAELVRAGHELGDADDKVFGRKNSKQQNGSIGLLTDDALTRTDYYVQAVMMALLPFKNPQFTWTV